MSIIYGYLARTIFMTIMLVTLVLTSIFIFVQLVAELSDLGKGSYGVWQALHYVVLSLPQQVYQFFPMTALIGCLMGLGTLASHSELIVMRAAGVSVRQILWAIIRMAIVLVLLISFLGEFPAPWLSQRAEWYKQHKITGNQHIQTRQGTWIREGDTFIHIAHIISPELLQNIRIYTFNKHHQLLRSQHAKTAKLIAPHQWRLEDVTQSHLQQNSVETTHVPYITWLMQVQPELLVNIDTFVSPDAMSLAKLNAHVNYLKANGLQYEKYALSLWRRLLQPISILIMMLLATPFIFGPLRTLPMGYRIMTGIIVGFSFYFLNQLFGPLSLLYRVPPWLSALLPLLPFALLSLLLTWRL